MNKSNVDDYKAELYKREETRFPIQKKYIEYE